MTRKTKITRARPAGENHQVLTLEGGTASTYRRKPCATCPWRKDAVGEFPAEAFRHSADTAYDQAFATFACHQTGAGKPALCAGFLLRGADHNIGVRLAAIRGDVDLRDVSDDGLDLFDDYFDMAVANGCDPAEDVLQPIRRRGR